MDLRTAQRVFKQTTSVQRSIFGNELVSRNSILCSSSTYLYRDAVHLDPIAFATLTVLMRPPKNFSRLTFCCGASVRINVGFTIGLGSLLILSPLFPTRLDTGKHIHMYGYMFTQLNRPLLTN